MANTWNGRTWDDLEQWERDIISPELLTYLTSEEEEIEEDYHAKNKRIEASKQDIAFHGLMRALRDEGVPESFLLDTVIPLWVNAVHAAEWVGWHSGYASASKRHEAA